MSTEIKTRRTHRSWLEKVKLWQCAYETKVCDSHREIVGRGSTPETSRDAACRLWNELMEGEHPTPARHTSPSIMPPPTSYPWAIYGTDVVFGSLYRVAPPALYSPW